MLEELNRCVFGVVRLIGFALAFPGNMLWKYGYNHYYGLHGGKVAIVDSVFLPPPPMPPTAPVTSTVANSIIAV